MWRKRNYLASGSELSRLFVCAGGLVLPHIAEAGADAARGQTIHLFLARCQIAGREAALEELRRLLGLDEDDVEGEGDCLDPDAAEVYGVCQAIPVDEIEPGLEPEVALGWNLRTDEVRVLGKMIERAYPVLGEDWIVLSTDLLGQTDEVVIDRDYKTGTIRERAHRSGQLGGGAVIAAKLAGVRRARVANVFVSRGGRRFSPDSAELGSAELDAFEDKMRALPARKAEAEEALADGALVETLTVGPHCTFCPSARVCPAHTETIRTFVHGANLLRLARRLPECSDAELTQSVVLHDLASRHLGRLREAQKRRAEERPIPLPGGMQFGPAPAARWIESSGAQAELAALRADLKQRGLITRQQTTRFVNHAAPVVEEAQPPAPDEALDLGPMPDEE